MGKLETIEKQIEQLSGDELKKFRAWFAEYDSVVWDARIESDLEAGKLDDLIAEAIEEDDSGESRPV